MSKTMTITIRKSGEVLYEKEVKKSTILATLFVVDCVAGAVIINTLK